MQDGRTPRTGVCARRLALGNVLIAAGTVVLSGSGTLAGRIGELEAFEVTLLVGISVLFVGFLVATSTTADAPAVTGAVVSAQHAPEDRERRTIREIDRLAVNEMTTERRAPWYEGETLMIPIYEEVLVTETKLALKEIIRVHNRGRVEQINLRGSVRREIVDIEHTES